MSRRKRKSKNKSKLEDKSGIIESVEIQSEDGERQREKQKEATTGKGHPERSDPPVGKTGNTPQKQKTSKDVYIAFLPEKYEPLIEDIEELEEDWGSVVKEEKERRKKLKYKKYRQNVGKALRFGWRCLVAGLQSFAVSYATPLSAATTMMSDVHRASSSRG